MGLHLKDMLKSQFIFSGNYLALGGSCPLKSAKSQLSKSQHTENKRTWLTQKGACKGWERTDYRVKSVPET